CHIRSVSVSNCNLGPWRAVHLGADWWSRINPGAVVAARPSRLIRCRVVAQSEQYVADVALFDADAASPRQFAHPGNSHRNATDAQETWVCQRTHADDWIKNTGIAISTSSPK